MRIISQNNLVDVSYDNRIIYAVEVKDDNKESRYVIKATMATSPATVPLGSYESLDKARKVMGMLKDAFFKDLCYYVMPHNEDV